jgi:hypothetical protein
MIPVAPVREPASATPRFPSPPARVPADGDSHPCPVGLSPHGGTLGRGRAVPRSRTQERGFRSLHRHERHALKSMSPHQPTQGCGAAGQGSGTRGQGSGAHCTAMERFFADAQNDKVRHWGAMESHARRRTSLYRDAVQRSAPVPPAGRQARGAETARFRRSQ